MLQGRQTDTPALSSSLTLCRRFFAALTLLIPAATGRFRGGVLTCG